MTALSTLAPALKRELAVPGTFDDVFPDTVDADLVASLADGFAEAQLYGYFPDVALTADTTDPAAPDWATSPDLSAAGGALITIFTSMRILRAQLRTLNSGERYKAGATEFEIQRSAMLLRDELKFLTQRLDELVRQSRRAVTSVAVIDNYFARGGGITIGALGGFHPYELQG